MTQRSMYRVLMSYLERVPGAMHEKELPDGEKVQVCVYSPHSLRATTAKVHEISSEWCDEDRRDYN